MTATRRRLADGRWFFQHGPMDVVLGADGDAAAVAHAVDAAWRRFATLLDELVAELPLLRTDLSARRVDPAGPVARRMVDACLPHAANGRFITAMAAVAGSVAQELIGFFDAPRIARAHVNDGGDIALHLAPGAHFEIGWVADVDAHPVAPLLDGRFRIDAASTVRGVATSGWRGRSLSLGIADSVTVLAATAAAADAAATVIANAVDVDDHRICRAPAETLRDASDLGRRLATAGVPRLARVLVERALDAGRARAAEEIAAGRVVAAVLCLQGATRICGGVPCVPFVPSTPLRHDRPLALA